MLIFNEKAYFFRRKKGEEQKKTRSILLNLVPCYLETVLIGQPLVCIRIRNLYELTLKLIQTKEKALKYLVMR